MLANVLPILQGCLAVAFLVEGLLFAFHLEGNELNKKAHLLLVRWLLFVPLTCPAGPKIRSMLLGCV